jgi:predicted glutamine amidotransferase
MPGPRPFVCAIAGVAAPLVVSEPLDDGRDDWSAVPPQSFVTLGPDGVEMHPLHLAA